MSTDFFGTKVSADKPTPYVPRPNSDNGTETLVLLNATIPASCKLAKGTRISLIVKTEICDSVALATLIVAQQDNAKMDIALDSYAEFSVMGPKGAEIHVTGHYLPKPPAEEDDEEGDLKQAFAGLLGAPSGYNGEDDEDDESDEDYEEDDDDEAPAAQGKRKKATVEITEVKVMHAHWMMYTERPPRDSQDTDWLAALRYNHTWCHTNRVDPACHACLRPVVSAGFSFYFAPRPCWTALCAGSIIAHSLPAGGKGTKEIRLGARG